MTGTADFGVVTERAELADPDPLVAARNAHRLAFDLVVDRVLQFIGGYHVSMGGAVDALVFAGGIGEHGAELRRIVAQRVRCLGYCKVDGERNENAGRWRGDVVDISVPKAEEISRPGKILVCRTDEQVSVPGIHKYIILTV